MRSSRKLDAAIVVALLLLPLLWFAPQAIGGKTLLPADNLFAFQPWAEHAAALGAGSPHNPLISDLILENYPWKSYLRDALSSGQIPLWSPRLFAGAPFLAAGQHSGLYPLSIIFYVLPLWRAYGVFTWLQVGLAAAGVYVFARVLGQRPFAGAVAGIAFAFSGFYITSVNFTMIIAAAAWLPLILALIELVIRTGEHATVPDGPRAAHLTFAAGVPSAAPYAVAGALCLGVQVLAGHIEITYYVLMVSAFYAVWRLWGAWLRLGASGVNGRRRTSTLSRLLGWLGVMMAAGLALGAVQLVPLYELVSQSFREGSASLQQVIDWAWPKKQIVTFLLPDAFGNPTHHSYFDIWRRTWLPVTHNALGQSMRDITGNAVDWGIKNYVEGANYLGIGTLLLAAVAVVRLAGLLWGGLRARSRDLRERLGVGCGREGGTPGAWHVLGFAVLAVLSLLFAFGTPLYAVLFYLAPGYSQLHSAFRWVYPYTLSMAVLAGFGLNWVLAARDATCPQRELARLPNPPPEGEGALSPQRHSPLPPKRLLASRAAGGGGTGPSPLRVARLLGGLGAIVGLGALTVVALSLVAPGAFVALGERLLAASDLARTRGFSGGAMAWSYEAMGLARFGAMTLLSGAVLWLLGKPGKGMLRQEAPALALIGILVLDLWLVTHSFNPATDPKLLAFKPPVIEWLQAQADEQQPWRLTTFDAPGEKLLNANSVMAYGLEDIRGYDSIIPRQYVAYMQRIQTQGELLYNRIAPLYGAGDGQGSPVLDSRLLDLLGVRYIVTAQGIPNANYRVAYPVGAAPAGRDLRVYENTDALPRAFIVPTAVPAAGQAAALDALQTVDPAEVVIVEGLAPAAIPPPASPQLREARISSYGSRQVLVDVNVSDRGWLVLADNYFPGWKAYLRPFGAQGEGVGASGESVEQQLPIYRADGTFRAVYLGQSGQWTVRFVYSPQSFLLGGYLSFLAGMVLLLAAGSWAWGRFYKGERSEIGTMAKNSVVQVVMSLLNRGIDFAFTMLRLRVLGPVGEGSYVNAINFYLVFEILTRFGLGTLLTRDVARDRTQAARYLNNVVSLRVLLWLAGLPLIFAVGLAYRLGGKLTIEEAQAIGLFAGALLFANIADAISSVFNAYEKMEYPAGLATATTVAKVALGALVLLPPFSIGFVGLAGVSLFTNMVQVVWLYVLLRRNVLPRDPAPTRIDWALQRQMLRESGPLMINHLLATVFWRISQFVLRASAGAAALGIFSVGVKFLDGLNVIPSYFTLAIFPLMSRYAEAGTDSLVKAYRLALQALLIVALPIAVFFTFAAVPLVRIVGGAAFLPDSATALAIMIWSITIGFMNSVTQYVLIAVNRQRFLTLAFIVGVAFTVVANLALVPRFGYLAAAAILVPAELSLFIPFAWAVHHYVAPMPWLRLLGPPLLAAAANSAVTWGLLRVGVPLLFALAGGALVYLGALVALGVFRSDDFAILRSKLPSIRLPFFRKT